MAYAILNVNALTHKNKRIKTHNIPKFVPKFIHKNQLYIQPKLLSKTLSFPNIHQNSQYSIMEERKRCGFAVGTDLGFTTPTNPLPEVSPLETICASPWGPIWALHLRLRHGDHHNNIASTPTDSSQPPPPLV